MALDKKLRRLIAGVASAAVLVTVLVFRFFPSPLTQRSLLAFLTLLALSTLSMMLYLKFTESGSTTSMDFVPELGAILLLGPAGAVAVTLASELVSHLFLYREKALFKKVFNTAQLVLAVAAAGVVYVAFTGTPSLTDLQFRSTLPPFILAVLVYFAVNTGTVAYVVSLSEGRPYLECWRGITAGLIVFDVAMSPLAYVVAYLYVQFNPLALMLAIIPLIGLRYSYGINFELRQLNTDLLRLMVKTIEAQDPYTSGHSIRVAETARAIARALKVKPKEAEIIETAALLHDIGKIDVAYSEILRQKGPLSAEQRELIRAHPDRGVDIIKSIRSIDPEVLRCVRYHHERWDGDGYPVGLEGEAIPRGARIIGVCDTIDAMTTARPYRGALPVEVVREELQKHSGGQFDPAVVTAILATDVLEKIDVPQPRPRSGGQRLAGIAPIKGRD
ncbi:MAG: HD-GYP domain-containing protein [Gemmatimonadota bacterium]